MRLLIVRHATAIPRGTPDVEDDARPLTRKGERRFRRAARGLASIVRRPDALLTSPLLRARQTADVLAAAFGKIEPVDTPSLAGGSFEQVAADLGRLPQDALVAVVGHEPDLSALLARLLGSPHGARFTFRKGGAALVELPGLVSEGGVLIWYVSPRLLRSLDR